MSNIHYFIVRISSYFKNLPLISQTVFCCTITSCFPLSNKRRLFVGRYLDAICAFLVHNNILNNYNICLVVGQAGLEPATNCLRGNCSTN